jgi:hypothetical protein
VYSKEKGDLKNLEEWAIDNILRGIIDGDYDEADLREEHVLVKVVSRDGTVVFDTIKPVRSPEA